MDMMMQYVKEVQTVQKKLGDCVESIGFINEVWHYFLCVSKNYIRWQSDE